jgi:hypothetical protein
MATPPGHGNQCNLYHGFRLAAEIIVIREISA